MSQDYLVEYAANGIPKVFEFYLFINPLEETCFACEQEIDKLANMISAKIDIHVICQYSHTLVADLMQQMKLDKTSLSQRNHVYQLVYLASLAYKAASMQGKRRGRRFLMSMQSRIQGKLENFTDDLLLEIAHETRLDVPTFLEDLKSDYAKELLKKDQRMARDMKIINTPALIIFEHRLSEKGILLEGAFTVPNILSHLDALMLETDTPIQSKQPILRLL